jgi:hypothetical protein
MSNALNSSGPSDLLNSVPNKADNGSRAQELPQPKIYGYNVISDNDHDILNQGSIEHIKRFFDEKQREVESNNILADQQRVQVLKKSQVYSVNSISFSIKLIIFVICVWILWDFIDIK